MSINHRQSGFAMIEVMVTVVIITIGISGMGILLLRSIQGTQDSAQVSQAMWIVQDYVGRMRANPIGAHGGFYELNRNDIDCTTPPTNLCAETYQNNAEVAASDCTADPLAPSVNKMAEFDNWIATCSLDTNVYDSPSDFIVNPVLTSTCTLNKNASSSGNNLPDCVRYNVNLTWQTKLENVSSDENARTNSNTYSLIVEFN